MSEKNAEGPADETMGEIMRQAGASKTTEAEPVGDGKDPGGFQAVLGDEVNTLLTGASTATDDAEEGDAAIDAESNEANEPEGSADEHVSDEEEWDPPISRLENEVGEQARSAESAPPELLSALGDDPEAAPAPAEQPKPEEGIEAGPVDKAAMAGIEDPAKIPPELKLPEAKPRSFADKLKGLASMDFKMPAVGGWTWAIGGGLAAVGVVAVLWGPIVTVMFPAPPPLKLLELPPEPLDQGLPPMAGDLTSEPDTMAQAQSMPPQIDASQGATAVPSDTMSTPAAAAQDFVMTREWVEATARMVTMALEMSGMETRIEALEAQVAVLTAAGGQEPPGDKGPPLLDRPESLVGEETEAAGEAPDVPKGLMPDPMVKDVGDEIAESVSNEVSQVAEAEPAPPIVEPVTATDPPNGDGLSRRIEAVVAKVPVPAETVSAAESEVQAPLTPKPAGKPGTEVPESALAEAPQVRPVPEAPPEPREPEVRIREDMLWVARTTESGVPVYLVEERGLEAVRFLRVREGDHVKGVGEVFGVESGVLRIGDSGVARPASAAVPGSGIASRPGLANE